MLAGAVWLLLQPPTINGTIDASVPIGGWTVVYRFATREACERQRSTDAAAILAGVGRQQDSGSQQARLLVNARRCIDASTLAPRPSPTA